jgi:hypothetical protein
MEIVRAEENRLVDIALQFDKPFKSSNQTTFTLEPQGETTVVHWKMVGPRPLVMRLLGPVFNIEKLVGRDFEKGLERMALTARPA